MGKGRHLSIRAFVLGVALLALISWCMVRESVKQTEARYRLAELARLEDEVQKRLDQLRAVEQELRSSTRLANVIREKKMQFVVIGSTSPQAPNGLVRRPGQVLEEGLPEHHLEKLADLDVATVGK